MTSSTTLGNRLLTFGCFFLLHPALSLVADSLNLHTRARQPSASDTNQVEIVEKAVAWDPARTAMVVCDMWDKHWCPSATERVGEMAPRMNEVLKAARARGVLIIHCPSDTMDFYKDHPGRKLAQSAPIVKTAIPLQRWCALLPDREGKLPIDDSDGGCDGAPDHAQGKAWKQQHPALEIKDGDAITDSAEAFYLMRQRGITNVIVMGVHINMCVLGRPFSIRQMVQQGQNVLLMRDLTDSMYNHLKAPFVSHFRGTELVVEHIEKFWCPSITSSDFLGGKPFQFKGDTKKHLVFIIGENEYQTSSTLPAFAKQDLEWRGYKISYVTASDKEGDNDFKNQEVIPSADALLISVRRRAPSKPMMDAIRAHVAAGKAVIGIRTASHAFEPKETDIPVERTWPHFDEEILGADYQNHYGAGKGSIIRQIPETAGSPILNGVKAEFAITSHLYKNRKPVNTVTPLLNGRLEDGQSEIEPVAWINTRDQRRVFYTSLGAPDDFANPNFRRLLLNGILWALGDDIPPASAVMALPASAPKSETPRPVPTDKPSARAGPDDEQFDPLPPAIAATKFHVADDLEWEQVLAEPIVTQPVFMTFDERGRLWVVQYKQYPNPAGLKAISHDNFWRTVYDKVPPPPPNHFKGADKITIHEDTRGTGVFDKHTTFVDGLNIVTSVAIGRGGVFVLNPPYLLFYPDRNHDDIPDGDPQLLLSGFGLEDTHSVANSLRWGPDGWLYSCQGSTVTGNILVHGTDGKPLTKNPVFSQGQNIWRYHPEKRIYEVFSEGGGNAFGLEFDDAGRIFSGHNGGNTRGFHYLQGAYLQKGFDKHGPLSNPYAFGYFPPMAHDKADRFTHNFILYGGGALPEKYNGKLFGIEPLQGRVVLSEITPVGSTFKTHDLSYLVTSDDKWFKPVDIKVGPDGAIYVADWYDRQVNHYRNHEGQMDASNGRIYRLRAKAGSEGRLTGNGAYPVDRLVAEAQESSRWYQQGALRLLADRRDKSKANELRLALQQSHDPLQDSLPTEGGSLTRQGQKALGSLLALNACGDFLESDALLGLTHWTPEVRFWAVRLLGDEHHVSPALARQLVAIAGTETNIEVRAQLACTAKRLPAVDGLAIVLRLLHHAEDATDARQPLLLWWAIEDKCIADKEAVLSLFYDHQLWTAPIVEQHILSRLMRRFAATGKRDDLLICARLFMLSPGAAQTAKLTQGFEEAYQGRPMVALPEELLNAMEKAGGESLLIATRRGKPASVGKALALIADTKTRSSQRLQLIQIFGEIHESAGIPVLLAIAGGDPSPDLRRAALAALQTYDDPSIATSVIQQLSRLPDDIRPSALTLLTSRPAWTLQLLMALEGASVDKKLVSSENVRSMKKLPNSPASNEIIRLTTKLWPNIRQANSAELEQEIHRLEGLINLTTGSPYSGKKLFDQTCAGCHKLFAKGGEIGPDLSTYPRTDLANLLLNIVNPNAEIREGYENFTVTTKDGRTLNGFLADQDAHVVLLRTVDGQTVALPRTEIARMEPSGGSLMPEGLLTGLGDQQIRDLFAYLRSTQPLNDAN